MKLFENKVGRPSNEILKKRRTFIVSIAVAIIAVIAVGVFALSNLNLMGLKGASYTKGQKISLSNAQIYISEKIKIKYAKKTGTFYIYNPTIKNNRIRISSKKNGISIGWVLVSDIKQATENETKPAATKTVAGTKFVKNEKVKLSNASIYASSSIKTKMGTKNGEFYIYNANISNNRIRISSKKNGTSLGWVNVSSIRKVNEQQNSNITSKYELGDVDMNGKLEKKDYELIMKAASGDKSLNANQKILADVNEDGQITAVDARLVAIKVPFITTTTTTTTTTTKATQATKPASTSKTTKVPEKYKVTSDQYTKLVASVCMEDGSGYTGAKAVIDTILNRVDSSKFPNTTWGALTQACQFYGYRTCNKNGNLTSSYPYKNRLKNGKLISSCSEAKRAVDDALANPSKRLHKFLYFQNTQFKAGNGTKYGGNYYRSYY